MIKIKSITETDFNKHKSRITPMIENINDNDVIELSQDQSNEKQIFNADDEKFFVPEFKEEVLIEDNIYDIKKAKTSVPDYAFSLSEANSKFEKVRYDLIKDQELLMDKFALTKNGDDNYGEDKNIIITELYQEAVKETIDLSKGIFRTLCNMYEGVLIDKKLSVRKGNPYEYKHKRTMPVLNFFKLIVENRYEISQKLSGDNRILFEYLASLIAEFDLHVAEFDLHVEGQTHWYSYYDDQVQEKLSKTMDNSTYTVDLEKPFIFNYWSGFEKTVRVYRIDRIEIVGRFIHYKYKSEVDEDSSEDSEDTYYNEDARVPEFVKRLFLESHREVINQITKKPLFIIRNFIRKLELHNNHINKFCSKHLVLAGLLEDGNVHRGHTGGFKPDGVK
jgi:hypothetical protein